MIARLIITQLVENSAGGAGLLGEHGAAFFIEADDFYLLFDTGQGLTFAENARRLQVPLERVEAVAISHGHYDHIGGLIQALALTGADRLYLHPDALVPKYNRFGQAIGPSAEILHQLSSSSVSLSCSRRQVFLNDDILLTGEIPRRHACERAGGLFYRDSNCQESDPLLDDQALVLDTADGLVVLLGCGHAGLVNTLDYIHELLPQRPIVALLGGSHLLSAGEERLAFTAQAMQRHGIVTVALNHCTGLNALCWLRQHGFPDLRESPAGTRHYFGKNSF